MTTCTEHCTHMVYWENSQSGVWLFYDLTLSLAANPEKSASAGAVATIEVLPSSDFRKEISPSEYVALYPGSSPF